MRRKHPAVEEGLQGETTARAAAPVQCVAARAEEAVSLLEEGKL